MIMWTLRDTLESYLEGCVRSRNNHTEKMAQHDKLRQAKFKEIELCNKMLDQLDALDAAVNE